MESISQKKCENEKQKQDGNSVAMDAEQFTGGQKNVMEVSTNQPTRTTRQIQAAGTNNKTEAVWSSLM